MLPLIAWATLAGSAAPGSIAAEVAGLRSPKGKVHICVTTRPDRFPNCQQDPNARRTSITAAPGQAVRFDGLPTGDYALALVHDENGNGKLDTVMGIPREGFGFSRNPAVRFGPPRFAEAQFAVGSGSTDKTVRVKYLL